MSITFVVHDLHSYVPLSSFGISLNSIQVYCVTTPFSAKASESSWSKTKAIVDKEQGVTKKLTKNSDISDPNYRDVVHEFSTI